MLNNAGPKTYPWGTSVVLHGRSFDWPQNLINGKYHADIIKVMASILGAHT